MSSYPQEYLDYMAAVHAARKAEAERDRLREALERIAGSDPHDAVSPLGYEGGSASGRYKSVVARSVLGIPSGPEAGGDE